MLGIEGRREGKWEKGRGRVKDSDRSWEWWRLSLPMNFDEISVE